MNLIIECLKAYPESIYEQELRVMEAMTKKQQAKSDIDFYLLGVEDEIAKNPELKNESRRKAAKSQFLIDSEIYQELTEKLEKCDRDYRIAQLELDKIKNEFSVAKIEARITVSSLEKAA